MIFNATINNLSEELAREQEPLTPWEIGPDINAIFIDSGKKWGGRSSEIVDTVSVNQGLFSRDKVFVLNGETIFGHTS